MQGTAQVPSGSHIKGLFSDIVQQGIVWKGNVYSTAAYHLTELNPEIHLSWRSLEASSRPSYNRPLDAPIDPCPLELPIQRAAVRAVTAQSPVTKFSPNDIEFQNPSWTKWVETTVTGKVRRDLGLDAREGPGGELVISLANMVLCRKGGRICAEKKTPTSKGGIGYLIILIPCSFTGADILFQYSFPSSGREISHTFVPSTDSQTHFHAIAWYSDTTVTMSPVVTGCMCALVYHMSHRESGPRCIPGVVPSASLLGGTECFEARLLHILRKWTQLLNQILAGAEDEDSTPDIEIPIKMVFGHKTRSAIDDISSILSTVACRSRFGILHAQLLYHETHYARPIVPRRPKRGYYERWELDVDGEEVQQEDLVLEMNRFDINTDADAVRELEEGLRNWDWVVDHETEVVGNVNCVDPSTRSMDTDWEGFDFEEGQGPVVFNYSIPVMVLFPLFRMDLVLADVGISQSTSSNSSLSTKANTGTRPGQTDTPRSRLRRTPTKKHVRLMSTPTGAPIKGAVGGGDKGKGKEKARKGEHEVIILDTPPALPKDRRMSEDTGRAKRVRFEESL
ncbi:hypothetical protein BDZ91DRAFT_848076 [Kalaharituber pfeilii]|nr:hypothetical protein BDZ91DRAFT_848076 [Kalaharituber pfeilii]